MSADDRRQVRQDKSKPLVASLKAWFEQQLARVSVKAKIADEIRYGLNHWDGLTRFLDDGCIELDTTLSSAASAPSCSIARTHSSPVTIMEPRTGPASPHSLRPAN